MFNCLFVCLFACLFVCLFVCLFRVKSRYSVRPCFRPISRSCDDVTCEGEIDTGNQGGMIRASTWKEISFQKEIWAVGRRKEGNENLKEIGRKFDDEITNLKEMWNYTFYQKNHWFFI